MRQHPASDLVRHLRRPQDVGFRRRERRQNTRSHVPAVEQLILNIRAFHTIDRHIHKISFG